MVLGMEGRRVEISRGAMMRVLALGKGVLDSWEESVRCLGPLGSRTQKGGGAVSVSVAIAIIGGGGGRRRKKRYCERGRGCTGCRKIRRDVGGPHQTPEDGRAEDKEELVG